MTDPFASAFPRRAILGSAFLGAAGFASSARAAPVAAPLDLNSARGNGYAYVTLHSDAAGGVGFNGLSGVIYSVVGDDGPITPLFGCESFSIGRTVPQADGTFRYLLRSTTLVTDLVTRAPLSQWRNPATGEVVPIAHTHFPSVCWVIGAEPTASSVGGSGRPTSWAITDDQAVYTAHNSGVATNPLGPDRWPRESAGRRIRTAEFVKVFASLRDLRDRRRTRAPYTGVWTSINPWEPWMLMGQAPGHLFQSSTIRRLPGPEAIDPRVRAYALERWPDCLSAPTVWNPANVSALQAYARDHKPAPL
jgi:hypothetical protein